MVLLLWSIKSTQIESKLAKKSWKEHESGVKMLDTKRQLK